MDGLKWRLTEILSKIKEDRGFRKILLDNADAIIDDVYTFADNGCGKCKKHILRFIDENVETINKVIDEYSKTSTPKPDPVKIPEEVVPAETPGERIKARAPKKIVGEVFEIDANPEAYKAFINHAQENRWVYRGLSVVTQTDKWIIFFY